MFQMVILLLQVYTLRQLMWFCRAIASIGERGGGQLTD